MKRLFAMLLVCSAVLALAHAYAQSNSPIKQPVKSVVAPTAVVASVVTPRPYPASSLMPTRFALCTYELADLQGQERSDGLKDCLRRRFLAEKITRKECKKFARESDPPAKNSDERFARQQQCTIAQLQASYKNLPTPVPRPSAAPRIPSIFTPLNAPLEQEERSEAAESAPIPASEVPAADSPSLAVGSESGA